MKRIGVFVKENYIFSSPYLIAIYTVLFLYANNLRQYRLNVLPTPLVLSLVLSIFVSVVAYLVFRKKDVSTVVASVVVFIILSYSRLFSFLEVYDLNLGSISISHDLISFVGTCVIILFVSYVSRKYKEKLVVVNKLLTYLFFGLILFSSFTIINFELKAQRGWGGADHSQTIKTDTTKASSSDPDIYYFIFDRYAGQKSLSEEYNFDNSSLLSYLENKGFYIASSSTTNYPKTFLSLASSLNMEYMDFLTDKTNGGESGDESIVTPYIRSSKVLEFLKKRGYSFINVGSWWEPTRINPSADVNIFLPKKGYFNSDEFTTGYLNITAVSPIFQYIFHDPMDVSLDPQNNIHRSTALYEFKAFDKIPQINGPKFVFTHILLPHDPFVFDKNCNPISEKVVNSMHHQENYKNQIICTNSMMKDMINKIFVSSKNPPVIILQADEGPFPMNVPLPPNQSWGTAETASLREKFPILNAYYFPNKKTTSLYESITPVNTFRVLFNEYFNANYPLLEDKNYIFQDENNYYKFIDVTDRIK